MEKLSFLFQFWISVVKSDSVLHICYKMIYRRLNVLLWMLNVQGKFLSNCSVTQCYVCDAVAFITGTIVTQWRIGLQIAMYISHGWFIFVVWKACKDSPWRLLLPPSDVAAKKPMRWYPLSFLAQLLTQANFDLRNQGVCSTILHVLANLIYGDRNNIAHYVVWFVLENR